MKLNHLSIYNCLNLYSTRFFNTQKDKVNLIKKISSNRTEWEKSRKETQEHTHHYSYIPELKSLSHSGFGSVQNKKSKIGLKYIGRLQTITKSTSEEKLNSLLVEISELIDDFTPYELIEIGYILTRINRPNCSKVVEPILHRFFKLPDRHSCLNGVYLHRLLRTMFIFQDVTYRVWVYEIAQMVSMKHDHLIMRDIQLIIDDLSLFYDAAAQGALTNLENSVVRRVYDLDFYRLPLIIHALGRCGYNTINVAKAVHEVYINNKGHIDYYSTHMIGLLLKGYCSFHFNPGKEFLEEAWMNMKDRLQNVEFKYLSWIMESFLRLRFFSDINVVVDELILKHKSLSHLEFTDFISGCWSIQTHLLSLEFRPYLVPGSIWQDSGVDVYYNNNNREEEYKERDNNKEKEKKNKKEQEENKEKEHRNDNMYNSSLSENYQEYREYSSNSLSPENNDKKTIDRVYGYYMKLISLIASEMPLKIYESTPPYRATQFELLTRLLEIYPNPRDFRIVLPLRKFDNTYPVLEFPSHSETPKLGQLEYVFSEMDYLSSSRFFGTNKKYKENQNGSDNNNKEEENNDEEENKEDINNRNKKEEDENKDNIENETKKKKEKKNKNKKEQDKKDEKEKEEEQKKEEEDFNIDSLVLDIREEPLRSQIYGQKKELKPLHPLLKQYIHAIFFRTPALAPRGMRLLVQGLVRIHFEQREDGSIDKDLIPNMKIKYYSRPLSKAIIREVHRKLACFNPDDLIVCLFGMLVLRIYDLELSRGLFEQAIPMWLHQKNEKKMLDEQKETLSLFFKTLEKTYPKIYKTIDKEALRIILE